MHRDAFREETRIEVLQALIHAHPLATLLHRGGGGWCTSLRTLRLDPDTGELGSLHGRVPRDHPLCRLPPAEACAVFQGREAWVAPGWGPDGPGIDAEAAPWNYVVVQARGLLRVLPAATTPAAEAGIEIRLTRLTGCWRCEPGADPVDERRRAVLPAQGIPGYGSIAAHVARQRLRGATGARPAVARRG